MDAERSCANKCIFCFIDQLPDGMRGTLYYKDDDVRLSFLHGNYITLTNLSQRDIDRIIKLRISPINVSVHTLNPEMRARMLGTKDGGAGIEALKTLAQTGITLNCQIVCCPGINDGAELCATIKGLRELGSALNSVSVVPVGLTKHRHGLTKLRPFDMDLAARTVRQVERFGEKRLVRNGSRVFYCADELYMCAGIELPPHDFYEDYPQLENGVGMMRLLITEFEGALRRFGLNEMVRDEGQDYHVTILTVNPGEGQHSITHSDFGMPFSIATGVAASGFLANLLKTVAEKYGTIAGEVYAIRNNFFGESVTVSGLVTGGDIIAQLKGRPLGSRLLIPQNMLRHDDNVFLDDVTVSEVSGALGVPIRVVRQDGADLAHAVFGG